MLQQLDLEVELVWECFGLAVRGSGFGGLEVDYAVLKDYCIRFGLAPIVIYSIVKDLCEVYKK